eukprot:scaffold298802_cov49-Tisochrysis_lutea.AAC.1
MGRVGSVSVMASGSSGTCTVHGPLGARAKQSDALAAGATLDGVAQSPPAMLDSTTARQPLEEEEDVQQACLP